MSEPAHEKIATAKRPVATPLKQQRLPATQPMYSPKVVIPLFFAIGAAFIIIGVVIYVDSDGIQSITIRYDDLQTCTWADLQFTPAFTCPVISIPFTIPKTMAAPSFVYYFIDNFHQNNRRWVKGSDPSQLRGIQGTSLSGCDAFLYPNQFVDFSASTSPQNVPQFINGSVINVPNAMYDPCGISPWSLFNDSFALYQINPQTGAEELICDGSGFDTLGNPIVPENVVSCSKMGIALDGVQGVRFNYNFDLSGELSFEGWTGACQSFLEKGQHMSSSLSVLGGVGDWAAYACNGWYIGEPGHRIPTMVDQDLMGWLQVSTISSFRKLYRRIDVDLPAGSYAVKIAQRWDISSFGGQKSFVLETTGWIGTPNVFLGVAYWTVGGCCTAVAVAFLLKLLAQQNKH